MMTLSCMVRVIQSLRLHAPGGHALCGQFLQDMPAEPPARTGHQQHHQPPATTFPRKITAIVADHPPSRKGRE